MKVKATLAIFLVLGGAVLYQASNWWERVFATFESSELSPDGCFRIDTFRPFWVLPSMLHRSPDPDPSIRNDLGRPWGMAIFKRAYEISTGELLGETVVFDRVGPAALTYWNEPGPPGRRIVYSNEFPLFDSDRCADAATLAKLEPFYEKERELHRISIEFLEAERNRKAQDLGPEH